MFDNTLIKKLNVLAKKEKKAKEFKRRIRAKGRVIKKSKTKKGNIRLRIRKGDDEFNFVVVKTHKERFALAEKLKKGDCVKAEGISRFRAIICTRLKRIEKIGEGRQTKLISR